MRGAGRLQLILDASFAFPTSPTLFISCSSSPFAHCLQSACVTTAAASGRKSSVETCSVIMNRRGHLSNKIPNVKLRPAPANASSKIDKRANSPEIWREAFEDGTNDAGDPDVGTSLPWKGIVITFTGIEDKVSRLSSLRPAFLVA